jgi:hypothetical protein
LVACQVILWRKGYVVEDIKGLRRDRLEEIEWKPQVRHVDGVEASMEPVHGHFRKHDDDKGVVEQASGSFRGRLIAYVSARGAILFAVACHQREANASCQVVFFPTSGFRLATQLATLHVY